MPLSCARASRTRAVVFTSLALLGCGTAASGADAGRPDAPWVGDDASGPDAGSPEPDASAAPDAGSCTLPAGRLAELSFEAPGLTEPSCADPIAIADAPVVVRTARITSVTELDGLHVTLDFCSPADPSCTGMSGALDVHGASLGLLEPPTTLTTGQFLEIHWRVASPDGAGLCTRELEVRNPATWDGIENPIRGTTPQLLLAAAHGVAGTLPGSLLSVSATPVREVTDDAGCPSGALSSLSFALPSAGSVTVAHGQTGFANAYVSLYRYWNLSSLAPASATPQSPTLDWIVAEHLLSI